MICLRLLLILACVTAGLLLIRLSVKAVRKKLLSRGDQGEQLLHIYRYIRRLSRISGRKIPPAVVSLAEKARFSQHDITEAERQTVEEVCRSLEDQLRKDPNLLKRFFRRFILCL